MGKDSDVGANTLQGGLAHQIWAAQIYSENRSRYKKYCFRSDAVPVMVFSTGPF